MSAIPIIIDCDPGNGVPGANVDDGLALALAIGLPERFDLLAVTVVEGNSPVDAGVAVARWLLDHRQGIPVYRGADRPLLEPRAPWRRHLDRRSDGGLVERLWCDTPAPPTATSTAEGEHAAMALIRAVRERPGEITVVAIGPLTNIALAMRLSPRFANDVARIVVMGGAFDVDGYRADTNFAMDPEAAQIVMRSGARITLVPLDVTTQTLLRDEDIAGWRSSAPSAERIIATTKPWVAYSREVRGLEGAWLHDVVTVALLADAALVRTRTYEVDVVRDAGPTRGHSVRWAPGAGQPAPTTADEGVPPGGRPVDVVVSVDNDRLVGMLRAAITRAS